MSPSYLENVGLTCPGVFHLLNLSLDSVLKELLKITTSEGSCSFPIYTVGADLSKFACSYLLKWIGEGT